MALPLLMRLSLSLYLPFFHFPLRFLHTSVCFLYHSLINLFHFHIIRPLPFTTNSISVTKISHNISLFRVCFVPFFFLLFPCFSPLSLFHLSPVLFLSVSPSPRSVSPPLEAPICQLSLTNVGTFHSLLITPEFVRTLSGARSWASFFLQSLIKYDFEFENELLLLHVFIPE